MVNEVNEKWGFGLAPPKPETERRRQSAARSVLEWLESGTLGVRLPEHLSETKGLFNRVVRQDQWDWFTVTRQLGYPSWRTSSVVANALYDAGRALRANESVAAAVQRETLRRLPVRRCLKVFLGMLKIADEPDAGWLYILSTRETPDLLKIGMTTRTVETRVAEINSATGVSIPFGVRHCWRVADPAGAERLAHNDLQGSRVRKDREFFRLDYVAAKRSIQLILDEHKLELRTLDNLSVLDEP